MSLEYTWKILSLKKTNSTNLSDVIIGTTWQVTGKDSDGNEGIFYGNTPFDLSKIDSNNFISYEDLTETIVAEWVKNFVTEHYINHVNDKIYEQINLNKYQVTEVVPKWNEDVTPKNYSPPEPEPKQTSEGRIDP